jgi:hypothetical protein
MYCTSTVGEVDFWIFNFVQFAIDWKNNSKKVFFFIFMSSYAEMRKDRAKKNLDFLGTLNPISTFFQKTNRTLFCDFLFLKIHFRIGRHENKEKHLFTLVLELFFQSIANCKKLKIQKIQKSTSPNVGTVLAKMKGLMDSLLV